MALSGREKITVGTGAAIVLVALLIKLASVALQSGGPATVDTISGAVAKLEQHKTLKASVEKLAEELDVEVPTVDITEQETQIRQMIAQLAQKNQMKISTLRRMTTSGRRQTATRPIQFRVNLAGPFTGLVQYVNALEQSKTPFVVRELDVNVARGNQPGQPGGPSGPQPGGRGRQNAPPTGQIQASLKLQAHLYPEVLKSDKPASASPAPTPGGPQPPQMPPSMTPPPMPGGAQTPAMTPPPEAKPASEAAAPAPAAAKTGRKTITMPNGMIIIIEGNTMTVNGKVQELSADQLEKVKEGLKQLPPGATVVEE